MTAACSLVHQRANLISLITPTLLPLPRYTHKNTHRVHLSSTADVGHSSSEPVSDMVTPTHQNTPDSVNQDIDLGKNFKNDQMCLSLLKHIISSPKKKLLSDSLII